MMLRKVAFSLLLLVSQSAYSKKPQSEINCLADAIYYESRSEKSEGQIAVAMVVLNRIKSGNYPSTICGVVRQKTTKNRCQFSWACNKDYKKRKHIKDRKYQEIVLLAEHLLEFNRTDPTKGSTHFHSKRVHPSWKNLKRTIRIGNHIFYKLMSTTS